MKTVPWIELQNVGFFTVYSPQTLKCQVKNSPSMERTCRKLYLLLGLLLALLVAYTVGLVPFVLPVCSLAPTTTMASFFQAHTRQ